MDYTLAKGKHGTREAGMCAMEWVAYLAGEKHTDLPGCVDPRVAIYFIEMNDMLSVTERQRLRPYLTRTIGTADDGRSRERYETVVSWLRRVWLPIWMRAAGRPELADTSRVPGTDLSVVVEVISHSCLPLLHRRSFSLPVSANLPERSSVPMTPLNFVGAAEATRWMVGLYELVARRVSVYGADAVLSLGQRRSTGPSVSYAIQETMQAVLRPGGLLDELLPLEPVEIPLRAEVDALLGAPVTVGA